MNGIERLALVMGQQPQQPIGAKRDFLPVFLFHETVRVTTQQGPLGHLHRPHIHRRDVSEHAKSYATQPQQLRLALGMHKQRRVVSAIHIGQLPGRFIQHSDKEGDVFLSLGDVHDPAVQPSERVFQRACFCLKQRANLRLKVAHQKCRTHSLATHIGHAHDRLPVVCGKGIVVIPAHLSMRLIVPCHVQVHMVPRTRQQHGLHLPCEFELPSQGLLFQVPGHHVPVAPRHHQDVRQGDQKIQVLDHGTDPSV